VGDYVATFLEKYGGAGWSAALEYSILQLMDIHGAR